MDPADENIVEIHGDEEIIEVFDLNETEPEPGLWSGLTGIDDCVVVYFMTS